MSISFAFNMCGQHLSTFVTVMIFIYTDNQMLTFHNIFTIILLSLSLSEAMLREIPVSIHFSTDLMTTFSRIQRFLERTDVISIKKRPFQTSNSLERSMDMLKDSQIVDSGPHIFLNKMSCIIPPLDCCCLHEEGVSQLNNISLQISSKGLVIITGSVGSGKSLLLTSIIDGELLITHGTSDHSGSIAYVSDTPWVFPGTIRENILFGSTYNKKWYLKTIQACQLENDFKTLPEQDLSLIGEHGATLSGGQRTRIALARAVYSQADVYLLDDPFSSLDAKVAEKVFNNVFKGMLSERIVILVAHNYFREADYIVKLDKGKLV